MLRDLVEPIRKWQILGFLPMATVFNPYGHCAERMRIRGAITSNQERGGGSMKTRTLTIFLVLLSGSFTCGQSVPSEVKAILDHSLQAREVVTFQLQEYLLHLAPKLPVPTSTGQWTAQAEKIRSHVL